MAKKKKRWTFLTNHAMVFVYISKHPQETTRKVAEAVNITERSVQSIVADLERVGYIEKHKEGRHNHYRIHSDIPLRHRLNRAHVARDLIDAVGSYLYD